jgi:hypothetical protein
VLNSEGILNSNRRAPMMAGMANKKENFPDNSLSIPLKSPKEMVMPEREIPGIKANP